MPTAVVFLVVSGRLETWRDGVHMPCVQGQVNAALIVNLRGSRPVNVITADNAATSTHKRVRDPAVLIAIAADGEHGASVQYEHGHPRSSRRTGSYGIDLTRNIVGIRNL